MSELPYIEFEKVSARLSAKLSDVIYQNSQLEVLAEALRDERDELQRQLDATKNEVGPDDAAL